MPVLAIFLTYDTITAMSIFRIVEKCKKQTNKQTKNCHDRFTQLF